MLSKCHVTCHQCVSGPEMPVGAAVTNLIFLDLQEAAIASRWETPHRLRRCPKGSSAGVLGFHDETVLGIT